MKKIKKVGSIFDMKLNQSNVKYMFLNPASFEIIPLRFYTLDTLSLPTEVSEPTVDQFYGYVKFRKVGIIFDMKLNQNNMLYLILKFGSKKTTPLCVLGLRYTLYVPQRYQYPFWTNFENM